MPDFHAEPLQGLSLELDMGFLFGPKKIVVIASVSEKTAQGRRLPVEEAAMKPVAETRVRARLMALKASLESEGDSEAPASLGRARLGAMQHQPQRPGDEGRRLDAIKRVDAALARVEENKYGYCTHCGAEIEDRRLEADPAAPLCAKCGGDQQ